MRTPALFGVKNFGFFEISGVSARIRWGKGLSQFPRESIFRDFMRTSFMDGLLSIVTVTHRATNKKTSKTVLNIKKILYSFCNVNTRFTKNGSGEGVCGGKTRRANAGRISTLILAPSS